MTQSPGGPPQEEISTLQGDTAASRENSPDWAGVVAQIQAGDPTGLEQLYRTFSRGVRYYVARQLPYQDLDDKIHEIFVIIVEAIRKGSLREPERLMGFVRTVAQRQVAGHIERMVHNRTRETEIERGADVADATETPERAALVREKADLVKRALAKLSVRDRELLERFYVREQTPGRICAEMRLTETQFRLYKSRAKARFGELGRREMALGSASPAAPIKTATRA